MNLENRYNGLWIGKLGNANSWYHIYPFAMAIQTKLLHILRHSPPLREVPKSICHIYTEGITLIECIKMFSIGIRIIKKYDIDYIVTFNPIPYGSVAWLLSRIFNKPIVIGLIGTDFYRIKRKWYQKIMLFILRRSEYVTVTGSAMKPYLRKQGLNMEKTGVYPHCVHDSWFETQHNANHSYDLITTSNLSPGKRIQDTIEAVYILKNRGINLSFIILGDGNQKDFLKNTIKKFGLENNIKLIGHQNNVTDYLKKSRIFVQASESEGLSISLIEAMALGIVPVATRAGSEEDIIEDGKNGFLVNIGQPSEIADAIEKLNDKKVYETISRNLESNRNSFKIDAAIRVAEKIINKLMEE